MKYSKYRHEGDSLELELFVNGLGLKSLHLGLWPKGQPLSFDNVSEAQENFTNKLVSMFPDDVETVLDVGAGIGDIAIYIAKKGMKVTCISPSPSQERYFVKNILPEYEDISFIRSKFEDLDINRKFDLVLMSESCTYFPMEEGLDQTIRYLKKGGHLVIGDTFRKDNRTTFKDLHYHESYIEKAKKRGLLLLEDVDVTNQVIQTVELIHNVFKHIPSMTEVIIDFYKKTFKKKYWIISKLVSTFFPQELDIAKDVLFDVGLRRSDPELFLEYITYRFLVFKNEDVSI
jgi:ubiquinone/menaquinone biosynthesis C-methylase UbiE